MNLINLFNYNYLKENLKKSIGVLSLFIGIIPIINILMLFSMNNNYIQSIPTLEEISIINVIGIFILPIVISVSLLGYVFKRKSVDFVGSMPISRKSIFVTNTIGGIIILILMNLLNAISIYILSSILPNVIIPFSMIIDYFILWTISYIFVFTVSNISVSLSGNMITSIVVSMLILFLIPFTHMVSNELLAYTTYNNNDYIIECDNNNCISNEYEAYNDKQLELLKDNKYSVYLEKNNYSNYTLPFNLVSSIFRSNETKLYNNISIIKMIILSIVYIIIGYILFNKRKMEVSETSFKNIYTHNIVKCLTMIPILTIVYIFIKESSISFITLLILLVIITAYFFIYDLITKKSISNIKENIITLIIYIPLFMALITGIDIYINNNTKYLKVSDITSINISNIRKSNNDISLNPVINEVYINNKDLVNYILVSTAYGRNVNKDSNFIEVNFKLSNGNIYNFNGFISDSEYEYIKNIISNDKDINNKLNSFSYDEVYAIMIGNLYVDSINHNELISILKSKLINNNIFITDNNNGNIMDLYYYNNHKLYENRLVTKDIDIINKIIEIENNYLKENIDSLKDNFNITFDNNYFDAYISYDGEQELINYIKANIDNKVNINTNYTYINIFDYMNSKHYRYYTNDIEGIKTIIDKYSYKEDIKEELYD